MNMPEWSEELQDDIKHARDRVREARLKITGGEPEKNAKALGKEILDRGEDYFERLDHALNNVNFAISEGKYGDAAKHLGESAVDELRRAHEYVREKRRGVTGGVVEDSVVHELYTIEEKLDDMVEKYR